MWFIGVEVEQETSAPPPNKNPGYISWRVTQPRVREKKQNGGWKVSDADWFYFYFYDPS